MDRQQAPEEWPLEFGERLTRQEYQRRSLALHRSSEAIPSFAEERVRRRAEFELNIDHRLGIAFPAERREALWQVQRKLDRRRGWHLVFGALTRPSDPSAVMTRALIRGFSTVLNSNELRALVGLSLEDIERPS